MGKLFKLCIEIEIMELKYVSKWQCLLDLIMCTNWNYESTFILKFGYRNLLFAMLNKVQLKFVIKFVIKNVLVVKWSLC